MAYRKNPLSLIELRCLAQQRLLGLGSEAITALALPEVQRLFEELQIHQIELELQNEYLNTARAQLEAALNQSGELYDFSPAGILSLDQAGTIIKLNLAGASLLEGERAWLLGNRLERYVADADVAVLNALLAQATSTG